MTTEEHTGEFDSGWVTRFNNKLYVKKERQVKNDLGSKTKRIIDNMIKSETRKIMSWEIFSNCKLASKC